MNVAKSRWLFGLALIGLQLVSCRGAGGGGVGAGGGGGGGGGGVVANPPPESIPIRRLTNTEYVSSTTDLFPGYTIPQPTFVPDTKVLGFLNLSSSQTGSLARMEQYEAAAQMIALGDGMAWKGVSADPTKLTGCDAAAKTELACAQPYLDDLAKRAYRRPLTDAERAALWDLFANKVTGDYPTRLGLAIEGVLVSPNFLFRPELGDAAHPAGSGVVALTPWEVATRLSYFINGSIPDGELTAAADSGRLSSVAEVRTQAQRLLALPRSQTNLVKLHELWLGIDTVSALTKDTVAFPTFTPALAVAMGQETRAFVQDIMFKQQGTFSQLLTAPYSFANADVAALYGVAAPANAWDRIELDPAQRMGLLTQPSLLATLAKDSVQEMGTAVRRGKFVLQQILCRTVQPPSKEIQAMFQPLDLTKTARDQAKVHELNAVCASCHAAIDPLGLPFEHYDLIGRWRDTDRGMPIDATGQLDGVSFDGIPQLAQLVATMPEARGCYLQQWFRFSSGRLNGDADQPYLDWLTAGFTPDKKLVDLVVDIVQSDAFRQLKVDPTAGSAP